MQLQLLALFAVLFTPAFQPTSALVIRTPSPEIASPLNANALNTANSANNNPANSNFANNANNNPANFANGNNVNSAANVANVDVDAKPVVNGNPGKGKREFRKVTNAERLRRGLGPLPPTKRSSAAKARRSGNPTASTESDGGDDSGDFSGPSVIRLRNPRDGSEVGIITFPGGDNGDLVLFDPSTGLPQRFQTNKPNPTSGDIIEIFPVGPGMADDDYFHGRSPLLAARPRPGQSSPNLSSGSPDFLHVGLAALDQGLLNIRLPARLLASRPGGALGNTGTPLDGVLGGGSPLDGVDGGLINAILPGDVLGNGGNPVTDLVGGLLGGGNDGIPAQSAIWQFDPKTRRLIAHYARPDGSVVPTHFVTGGPCEHLICLTADVEAFKNAYGESAVDLHALVTVL